MSAFFDARCTRCNRRFGWCGEITDRPACPKCGHRPPQEQLKADADEIEKFETFLINRKIGGEFRKARMSAGKTLVDTADHFGMTCAEISAIERGEVELGVELEGRMRTFYGMP